MSDAPQHDRLLEAVEALTKPRTVHTTITDDNGAWLRVHSETHPPLLIMLIEGTGITGDGTSRDPGIPIDADALEMWGMIRDLIKLWSRKLGAHFIGDDLPLSITRWHLAHRNAHRAQKVSDTIDHDVTRMLEGWVRMIETKFDPPEKREWTDPCPAYVPAMVDGEPGYKRCNARRVIVKGEERFAITLNVTTMTAECVSCKCKWVGDIGVLELRQQTELARLIREEEADTPTVAGSAQSV